MTVRPGCSGGRSRSGPPSGRRIRRRSRRESRRRSSGARRRSDRPRRRGRRPRRDSFRSRGNGRRSGSLRRHNFNRGNSSRGSSSRGNSSRRSSMRLPPGRRSARSRGAVRATGRPREPMRRLSPSGQPTPGSGNRRRPCTGRRRTRSVMHRRRRFAWPLPTVPPPARRPCIAPCRSAMPRRRRGSAPGASRVDIRGDGSAESPGFSRAVCRT